MMIKTTMNPRILQIWGLTNTRKTIPVNNTTNHKTLYLPSQTMTLKTLT